MGTTPIAALPAPAGITTEPLNGWKSTSSTAVLPTATV